ncbi:MAG: hypothetical protein AAF647_02180 [Pseudomonadota bacterium]
MTLTPDVIREILDSHRGLGARLGRKMDLDNSQITKIKTGKRRITHEEGEQIAMFFAENVPGFEGRPPRQGMSNHRPQVSSVGTSVATDDDYVPAFDLRVIDDTATLVARITLETVPDVREQIDLLESMLLRNKALKSPFAKKSC